MYLGKASPICYTRKCFKGGIDRVKISIDCRYVNFIYRCCSLASSSVKKAMSLAGRLGVGGMRELV